MWQKINKLGRGRLLMMELYGKTSLLEGFQQGPLLPSYKCNVLLQELN